MANEEHLQLLTQGVDAWNFWRSQKPSIRPDLRGADLRGGNLLRANLNWADLGGANFFGANLVRATLRGADLRGANLHRVNLRGADLRGVTLREANLFGANLSRAYLFGADLSGANIVKARLDRACLGDADLSHAILNMASLRKVDLSGANLGGANFADADLCDADLAGAYLDGAHLRRANLRRAKLVNADLIRANLNGADLDEANLGRANLSRAHLVETSLVDATLTDCRIYGISAWNVKLGEGTKQLGLVITRENEPPVTVDDLEVAQFVHLLLHNEKLRKIIDTVGRKSVLLLGRFTEGRIVVLERLREALRRRGYAPIVFNFDKPETKDFTETVRLLAGLAKFVIADVTNPKSAPLELQATVPEIMVPFQPIVEDGENAFAMLADLQRKHDWVFRTLRYSSIDRLIETMDEEIVGPAEAKFTQLLRRRAEPIGDRRV